MNKEMKERSVQLRNTPLHTEYWILLSVFLFILASCTKEEKIKGYTETKSHLFYKLLAIGDGKKTPKSGEWLLIQALYKTQNDSVFWDSEHDSPDPYYIVFKDRC